MKTLLAIVALVGSLIAADAAHATDSFRSVQRQRSSSRGGLFSNLFGGRQQQKEKIIIERQVIVRDNHAQQFRAQQLAKQNFRLQQQLRQQQQLNYLRNEQLRLQLEQYDHQIPGAQLQFHFQQQFGGGY